MSDEGTRLAVNFSIEVPLDEIQDLKQELSELHQGTMDYLNKADELKAVEKRVLGRLDGECLAYMNIAKAKLKKLFDPSEG